MSPEEVSVIMWQLLQALKFLHANNVWHRCVSLRRAITYLHHGCAYKGMSGYDASYLIAGT